MEVERLTAVLEASGLGTFNAQMAAADRTTGGLKDTLDRLTAASEVATKTLHEIRMKADQAAATAGVSDAMKRSLSEISTKAERARADIERVKMDAAQVAETTVAADRIEQKLEGVSRKAGEARRSLESVRLAGMGAGGAGGGGIIGGAASSGGFGGGGFGAMPAAIGGAALLAPAAGPGIFGLLSTLPVAIGGMVGTVGTLALAFDGVTKAIGGNLKAFKDLQPAAQQFVLTVRSLDGWFDKLRQTAGKAMFPGLTEGLKAALSPGTVQQITTAVSEFGKAIGEAGAAWGRYFGSSQFQSIFGPLMSAGARNLGKMSDAALHLFDALGVLGRAAIPLVNWMTNGADAAAKWIDNFTRAKDASGGLTHAMDQAKTSLKLVGGLVAALAKTVYDLGAALYPVSKVALRDLTVAISAVDGWLKRNRQTITEIAGVIVNDFAAGIVAATKAVGAFYGSMKQDLGSNGAKGVVIALGAAIAVAFGGWPAIIAASVVAVGAIVRNWTTIKDFFKTLGQWILNAFDYVWVELQRGAIKAALHMVEPFSHLPGFLGGWARKAKDSMQGELDKLKPPNMNWSTAALQAGVATGDAWMAGFAKVASQGGVMLRRGGQYVPPPKGMSTAGSFSDASSGILYLQQQAAAKGWTPDQIQQLTNLANYEDGSGKPGDHNTSFGPFQLHAGGQLPAAVYAKGAAFAQQWAWSPAGINWALQNVSQFKGLQGQALATALGTHQGSSNIPAEIAAIYNGGVGTTSAGSVFGTPPPFTSGLGTKPPKPPVIPASVTHLLNLASTNATNASALSNTGGTAKRYLELELMDLDAARKQLQAAFEKAHGKAKTQLDSALTRVGNSITKVNELISKAIVVTGDALLPEKLKSKLAKLSAQGAADADYAAALTGQAAVDYQTTLRKNLLAQAAVMQQEVKSLKGKLASASGKQKTAIQAEITKVTSALDQVQQSILSNLQQTVQTLQGQVASAFSAVQSALVKQLGDKFFQNGLQTPSEALLSSMQAQDQMNSLTDALQAAKDQQTKDQNTLSSVVYDMTTGKTTYNYSSAAQAQLAADQKAVAAAQRQLDEYNLSIKAAQERQSADQTYASQLDELNKKLGPLADAFQNGTGSMSALKEVAKQFGLQIAGVNMPDMTDLSSASKGLKDAFKDLADYIAKITGATPKIPATPASVALLNSQALSDAQASGNVSDIIQAARDAGYTQSIGYLRRAGLIPMADGGSGRVTKPTLFLAGEAGAEDFAFSGGGRSFAGRAGGASSGVVVNLSVSTLDPASVDWAPIAEKIRAELIRTQRRNGGSTGIK